MQNTQLALTTVEPVHKQGKAISAKVASLEHTMRQKRAEAAKVAGRRRQLQESIDAEDAKFEELEKVSMVWGWTFNRRALATSVGLA